MRFRILLWIVALALLATAALAADVSGKWTAETTRPDGQTYQTTFDFKVSGEELTGTVSGRRGDTPISEGKISGDDISFVVVRTFNEREVKMLYKGKVAGDEIKLTVTFGESDRSFEMTAKRAK
jgi:hypothetical protein